MADGVDVKPLTNGSLADQKPLPEPPHPDTTLNAHDSGSDSSAPRPQRTGSQRQRDDADDMNVDDSDGETVPAEDAGAVSEAESINVDDTKTSKKKKSQRFYCTEYPPCNLNFTRSEHLARHIR